MSFKEHKIYRTLRKPLVIWRIYRSFFYDANRYIKYSNSLDKDGNQNKLVSTIIKAYHVVEKGLTMPEMRRGFGQVKLKFLIGKCNDYITLYDKENYNVENAIKVIFEYYEFHKKINYTLEEDLVSDIINLRNKFNSIGISEQEDITPNMVNDFDNLSFRDFSFSRSSVRNYSDKNIEIENIFKSVEIAQNAPSACNRQPSRVHVIEDKEMIKNILKLQSGNKGFGHLANKLIVLTTDLNGYHTQNERYMNWIDGGIYLMNLIYGLHFHKIGSCILNWGVDKSKDINLRQLCNIKNNESLIAIISCGYYLNETCRVAKSPKRRISEVIIVH